MPRRVILLTMLVLSPSLLLAKSLPEKLVVAVEQIDGVNTSEESLAPQLKSMLSSLDVDVEYFFCPWARCLQAMENGDVDLLDKLYQTKARQQYISFLTPSYLEQDSTFQFYSHKDSNISINSITDLENRTVGVIRSAIYFPAFDHNKKIRKVPQVHLSNMILMTVKQRIDVLIAAPEDTPEHILSYPEGENLRPHPYKHVYTREMFIGVSKQSKWLPHTEELNHLLQKHTINVN